MNRHDTTIEHRRRVLDIPVEDISPETLCLARKILRDHPADQSKWFTRLAVTEYQAALRWSMPTAIDALQKDPHTRQAVIYGPQKACWISTQALSLSDGGYHIIACYRSMDLDHIEVDSALQYLIGCEMTGCHVEQLTLMIGSLHKYKSNPND